MARFILLDAGLIGLACSQPGIPEADQCRKWLVHLETSASVIVVIPAVIDYDVRRELLRLRAAARLRRLDALRVRFGCLGVSPAACKKLYDLFAPSLVGLATPVHCEQDLGARRRPPNPFEPEPSAARTF